jgi:hypothetical protein
LICHRKGHQGNLFVAWRGGRFILLIPETIQGWERVKYGSGGLHQFAELFTDEVVDFSPPATSSFTIGKVGFRCPRAGRLKNASLDM